jgi:putative transposase
VALTTEQKRQLIQLDNRDISLFRKCELLGLSRSSYYYRRAPLDIETERLMNLLDRHYTEHPYEGKIKRARWLSSKVGYTVGKKRVATLMKNMGLETIYPKPNTSVPDKAHAIYPYLLRDKEINAPNQVWSTDITYIPLLGSHVYLMAIIDWYSRYVIEWSLSITLEADFCVEALKSALLQGRCDIFNTDQGSQFTSEHWIKTLVLAGISISMDGRGRYLDNIFVERLWRSVKQECIYLHDFASVAEVKLALKKYFEYYNHERLHQSLDYRTPAAVYFEG